MRRLLEKTNTKVLVLDRNVYRFAEPNLKGIIVALEKSTSKIHEIKMMPGLNHRFKDVQHVY